MTTQLRLTQNELENMLKDMCMAGIKSFRVLDLDEQSAQELGKAIDSNPYNAKVEGPSIDYDPLKESEKYSVLVQFSLTPKEVIKLRKVSANRPTGPVEI